MGLVLVYPFDQVWYAVMGVLVLTQGMAGTFLTDSIHTGTIFDCMAKMRVFSFKYLVTTKDTRLFLDEADSSVRENIIDLNERLIAVFTGASDESIVYKFLLDSGDPSRCIKIS